MKILLEMGKSFQRQVEVWFEIGDNLDGEGKSFRRQVGVWLQIGDNLDGDGWESKQG